MSYSYRVTNRSVPLSTRTVPVRTTRSTYRTTGGFDPELEMERTRREFDRMTQDTMDSAMDPGHWGSSRLKAGADFGLSPPKGDGTSYQSYETDPLTGERQFKFTTDIKGIKPEDVHVKVDGNLLTISGEQEDRTGGITRRQKIKRSIDIPNDITKSGIKAQLNNMGYLQIIAPASKGSKSETSSSPLKGTPVKVTKSSDYKGEFTQTLDVGKEFADGELSVHYVDDERKLIAKGRIQQQHLGRLSIREFTEELDMDESIDPDTIQASMDDYGQLMIRAMKK